MEYLHTRNKKDAAHYRRGFIALILIIAVGSMIIVLGLSMALMQVDEFATAPTWLTTAQSFYQTTSCTDNMLMRFRNNSSLSGNVNIASVLNVNCTASISGSGNTRTVVANATSTDFYGSDVVSRVTVNVNINTNPFTIESYKDILE